jgi:hypothetical protein
MESTRVENLPPPPGVINSIRAGFDAIAAHLTAILLPVALDLFLWLGPRLRAEELFESIKPGLSSIWSASGASPEGIRLTLERLEAGIPTVNLFWLLRTIPIGISSLLLPQQTSRTPLGNPSVLQVSALDLFGWFVLLTLLGWIGGGLYFRSVSWLAAPSENHGPISIPRAISQTILLSILWSFLSVFAGLPFIMVMAVLLQINQFIATLSFLFLSLASMWVIVPIFFWPHGIFQKGQNFITSIVSSIQLARFTLPTSSMFVLTILMLALGLNYLWSIPPDHSWMTLVGILGHAFVTTALLAASFIYYRDMNAWLLKVLERLKANAARRA